VYAVYAGSVQAEVSVLQNFRFERNPGIQYGVTRLEAGVLAWASARFTPTAQWKGGPVVHCDTPKAPPFWLIFTPY
jgi:hypothetical protein